MTRTANILIISEYTIIKTFMLPTMVQLRKETAVEFDCLLVNQKTIEGVEDLKEGVRTIICNPYPTGWMKNIPRLRIIPFIIGLRKIVRSLGHYDCIHILFHHYYYSLFADLLKAKASHRYITYFGSDFNDVNRFRNFANSYSIHRMNGIFATNPAFLQKVITKHKIDEQQTKTGILIFYVPTYEALIRRMKTLSREEAKKKLGISKTAVVIGNNASFANQHEAIILSLETIKNQLGDCIFLFPMTYGNKGEANRKRVRELMDQTGLEYRIFADYLAPEEVMEIRLASDIYIHLAKRDQLSGSMLEHLAAGARVITGTWLPFQILVDQGVSFARISRVEQLNPVLLEELKNLTSFRHQTTANAEIVASIIGWNANRAAWLNAYNLVSL